MEQATTLKLKEKAHLLDNIWSFRFEPSEPFTWVAGQFIRVELPHDNPDAEGTKRWFTVSAPPFEGVVQITTRVTQSTFKQALSRVPIDGELQLLEKPDGDFVWVDTDKPLVFIAGGIGITPILGMIHRCIECGHAWRLLYCVRSRRYAAYLEQLELFGHCVVVHADDEHSGRADFDGALQSLPEGWHVYTCGPAAMMDAVCDSSRLAGISASSVHLERFGADPADAAVQTHHAFSVRLLRHGGNFSIPEDRSILDVLEANGVALPSSCRAGLCRSCEVPLVSGHAEHRDYVLSEEERCANQSVLICVSRAKCGELVLDI